MQGILLPLDGLSHISLYNFIDFFWSGNLIDDLSLFCNSFICFLIFNIKIHIKKFEKIKIYLIKISCI